MSTVPEIEIWGAPFPFIVAALAKYRSELRAGSEP